MTRTELLNLVDHVVEDAQRDGAPLDAFARVQREAHRVQRALARLAIVITGCGGSTTRLEQRLAALTAEVDAFTRREVKR